MHSVVPPIRGYLPPRRDGKGVRVGGERECCWNHIAQQLYFTNFSVDLKVVSCCQVVDAVDWKWLLWIM